jgi:hypothetical protein
MGRKPAVSANGAFQQNRQNLPFSEWTWFPPKKTFRRVWEGSDGLTKLAFETILLLTLCRRRRSCGV